MVTQTEKSVACWNCGQATERIHFCEHCGSLQAPSGDYFAYLGLPRKLQIDLAELQKNFYRLSRRLHPDIYFQRPARERGLAEEATARLNDAYRTLQDQAARAEYLLDLHGMKKSEQKSSNVPPELLEEVFDLNMALEEIRSGDESVRPQLLEAKARFEGMLRDVDQALEAGCGEWDRTGGREALERIYGVLNRRNYIRNLIRDVNAALGLQAANERK